MAPDRLRVRLLFKVVESRSGEVRVRDLPNGHEWIAWRWQSTTDWVVLRVVYAVSPNRERVLLLEERESADISKPAERRYVFALGNLRRPWEPLRSLDPAERITHILDYPVWLDNSTFAIGVSTEPDSAEGYRVFRWSVDTPGGPTEMSADSAYYRELAAEQVARARRALSQVPPGAVPEDVPRWLDRLGVSPWDGGDITTRPFELRRKTHLSLSPSGTKLAIADNSRRVLTIFDLGTGRKVCVGALSLLLNEATRFLQLRWSPDERWLLFTEEHDHHARSWGMGSRPGGGYEMALTASPAPTPEPAFRPLPGWGGLVSFVRAVSVDSSEALTLVVGEDAFWLEPT